MMSGSRVTPEVLHAWLSARSIALDVPLPVADRGGLRVDTGSETEIARWVFHDVGAGLEHLARTIAEPRYFLKLCGSTDDLRAALSAAWTVGAPGHFMRATDSPPARRIPDGYAIEVTHTGALIEARIVSAAGDLAASGYAVGARGVFIYDRIVTAPTHRRLGLGHAVMRALHDARQQPDEPQFLVATDEGRALYSTLGWDTISAYSTASIAARRR